MKIIAALDHRPFGIGLCIAKEGGMAVSAVWRLVCPLAAYPSEPRSTPQHTSKTPAPLSKNLKASGFWYSFMKTQRHTLPTQSDGPQTIPPATIFPLWSYTKSRLL